MRGHSPPGRSEPWGEPGDCLGREVADPGKTPEESRHFCVSPPKPACILQPHIPLSLLSLSSLVSREHPGDGFNQEKGLLSEKWVLQGGGRKGGGMWEERAARWVARGSRAHSLSFPVNLLVLIPSHLSHGIHRELLEASEMDLSSATYQLWNLEQVTSSLLFPSL